MKVDDGVGAFEMKTRVNSLFIMKKWLTTAPSTQWARSGVTTCAM
jgi:hypothetical protein